MLLSPLGLGTWQFSSGKGLIGKYWSPLEEELVQQIIKLSLEGGVNWFDTAEAYGGGESERVLAAALNKLEPLSAGASIATKWWPLLRSASHIPKTIDIRLQKLQGRPIDLYQIHQPFSFSKVSSEMKQMAKLAEAGKISHIGVSNFSAKQMYEADRTLRQFGLRLASNQVKYNLLDRRIERNGVLQAARELGCAIIAYSPLEQGLLTGKFHKNAELLSELSPLRKRAGGIKPSVLKRTQPLIDQLEQLADLYDVSPTQIALNWLIHSQGDTVFAIPGASKPHHAREIAEAMNFRLTEDELLELSDISALLAK
ncbi:aldo/keto reductase [Paenibacillus protaetiae]|uniref:Aldo/keto reductase n=2 Tax=Paenibacillus protaetiae TaxID=2509456 RepID=A0A4P6F1C6_9BACL|nr:aldo/keto reductase [Paenibacillus protaetiae]QAY68443.1 aldo/keto reductase [Paenibacillus protaetiae]